MNRSFNISFPYPFPFQVVVLILLMACPAFAEDIRLSATVDKTRLTLEDTLELSITVHGVRNPPLPQLPPLPDFRVRSAGTQSSTQIINSTMRVSMTHKYLLIPKSVGRFVIASAVMELDGAIYKSDPINISVSEPKPGRAVANEPVFVETSVSNENPFVNEQVVYRFKLFRRVEARNLNLDMPYDDTLFRKEDLGKARRYSQVLNGIAYDVHEISVALFPLKPGAAVIPPSMLELDLVYRQRSQRRRDPFSQFFNDPFFGGGARGEHKILTAPQVQLNVQPLPESGKPADFRNMVGRFGISAVIGKPDLEAGDTTTLTVTVSGTGNLMDTTLSEPDLQGQFKVYPDQPELKQTIHGDQIGGEKIFKFALVPYSAGEQTIPSIPFSYFDPEKKTYVTIRTRPIKLTVHPGAKDEKLNLLESGSVPSRENGASVKILARDILPIHTRLADFADMGLDGPQRVRYAIGMLLPILVYFFAAGYINYRQRMKYDTAYFRSQGAYNQARQKLNQLAAASGAGRQSGSDSKDFVRDLSLIVREYIGNKLNLQGTAFTSSEVEAKLKEKAFAEEQAASMRKLLEKCESLQYAPVAASGGNELIDESLDLLKQLEKQA
ncbi:MAG: protein BatD [Nitrospinae bacterium]|nr:protein BatD [Nitrospinota bacterium]